MLRVNEQNTTIIHGRNNRFKQQKHGRDIREKIIQEINKNLESKQRTCHSGNPVNLIQRIWI